MRINCYLSGNLMPDSIVLNVNLRACLNRETRAQEIFNALYPCLRAGRMHNFVTQINRQCLIGTDAGTAGKQGSAQRGDVASMR